VKTVEIVDYKRDMLLESIPTNKAYRVDGVHMYADILNLDAILATTAAEGERCHKRTLRFLNLHQRAVSRILTRCDARRVDFHNQRLHALVAKPYGTEDEKKRVCRAVAIGKLITDVLAETGDDDEDIPNAKVRIGIDTGKSLAVNNGRGGNREPLFLGAPANLAAKLASNLSAEGIFLTNTARKAAGLKEVEGARRRRRRSPRRRLPSARNSPNSTLQKTQSSRNGGRTTRTILSVPSNSPVRRRRCATWTSRS
jgi:class 3 adenylate cyclase